MPFSTADTVPGCAGAAAQQLLRVPHHCEFEGDLLVHCGHRDLLKTELELLGFAVSRHPLDLYSDVKWNTYCPIADVGKHPKQRITIAGMIVEDGLHLQMDGRIMKFISICDYSGILECELFASAYRRFGIGTVRHPVVEVRGKV
jgi:DNA polymerase III alpha subunit